ncbi:DUF3599 family protein [Bacillus amyloliquefaciens]|uniref:DUF3599 family protein n=1 Tax=Bacillus amyloliquefaciens TaxID=1390 RepID=UPI0022B0537F|nr:DUF3599 family protein [Bacillus amyloliquefaciens]MCZ4248272.1 DUF3599 family protein [Bacillus amyloliquefaciens]
MSYERLLTDRCDIYHERVSAPKAGRFGIPAEKLQPDFSYPEIPDAEGVPCLFVEKQQQLIQLEPDHKVYQRYLVHFPKETVLRVNDKIVWEDQAYILEMPKKARQHHWEAIAVRDDRL